MVLALPVNKLKVFVGIYVNGDKASVGHFCCIQWYDRYLYWYFGLELRRCHDVGCTDMVSGAGVGMVFVPIGRFSGILHSQQSEWHIC